MHVGLGGCTRGATLEKPRCFLKHQHLLPSHSLTAPSPLSPLSPTAATAAAAFSRSDNSKVTFGTFTGIRGINNNTSAMAIDTENKGKKVVSSMEQEEGKDVVPPSKVTPVQVPPTNDDEPPSGKHRNYVHYHEKGGPTVLQGDHGPETVGHTNAPRLYEALLVCVDGVQAQDKHLLLMEVR